MLMGFEHDSPMKRSPRNLETCLCCREAEVEEHELMHLPLRSWCRHCVRAKGKASPHPESSPGGVSKFVTDYKFMGEDGTPITILAGYDGLTKTCLPNVVLCKGTCHGYAQRALAQNVLSTGHQNVILQSDQEPSIIDVKHKSGKKHPNQNRVRRESRRRQQRQRQH